MRYGEMKRKRGGEKGLATAIRPVRLEEGQRITGRVKNNNVKSREVCEQKASLGETNHEGAKSERIRKRVALLHVKEKNRGEKKSQYTQADRYSLFNER